MQNHSEVGKRYLTLLMYRIWSTLSYQMMMVAIGWHLFDKCIEINHTKKNA